MYLKIFEEAAGRLDAALLAQKKLEVETGVWLDSVVLRLQKSTWANKPFQQPQTDSSIFFSVWFNEKTAQEGRFLYNIHALRLRQLEGYRITSREFAERFRARFVPFTSGWPNLSVEFGPQTLMQGWEGLTPAMQADSALFADAVFGVAVRFLTIDSLIDELLLQYKRPVK